MERLVWMLWLMMGVVAVDFTQAGDFVFRDFNVTTGLVFNGVASTTSCEEDDHFVDRDQPGYGYDSRHGKTYNESKIVINQEDVTYRSEEVTMTDTEDGETISKTLARFGHRDNEFYGGYASSVKEDCALRLRLTPSNPHMRSSVWYEHPAALLQGFISEFAFQITDLSRTCTHVRDNSFSSRLYESCVVHGGDGFAFVLQADSNGTETIGCDGENIGYAGISNSVAVEFDTWYNPEKGDIPEDHVTIHAAGDQMNSAGQETSLNEARKTPLADGKIHKARVAYYPHLKYEYIDRFSATLHGRKFMLDNQEGYRIGMLIVWVDDMTTPLVAVPINLSVAIKDAANIRVGFTSSTGKSWEKHDILSWTLQETV